MTVLWAVGGVAGTLLLVAVIGASYQALTAKLDLRRYPPPGRLVDVGGYWLHVHTMGEGDGPTVVIETGRFNPSVLWTEVQEQLAGFARVVTYDRAGYGWSDTASTKRSGEQVARDLHLLLQKAEIPGPYLLVAHSLGAMYARLFAHEHPEAVAGIILVDPYTEFEVAQQPATLKRQQERSVKILSVLARLGIVRVAAHINPGIADGGRNLINRFPAALRRRILALISHAKLWQAVADEWSQLDGLVASLHQRGGLGEIPLLVISAGRSDLAPGRNFPAHEADALWALMKASQARLMHLASRGKLITAADCGHGVHLERPDIISEAVREMLGQYKVRA